MREHAAQAVTQQRHELLNVLADCSGWALSGCARQHHDCGVTPTVPDDIPQRPELRSVRTVST